MEQKKKHKGLIGIIIGVVLCLSILPVTVFAEGGLKNTGGGGPIINRRVFAY